ncbi:TPA: biotin/lipoyl-binding protein, partial [Klebsiella oxytoca]|nr:biotin/lipoyl-binding protein [Klebsiella oxytoca]
MLKNIYRKEAIEYKKIHWKGKALLLAGIPAWLVTLLAFIFLIAIVLSLIFCTFTQRIDVRGEVITLPHSVNVFAPQQGFVVNLHVKVGDIVKKGQPLYELDVSRNTIGGNVSAAQ